MWYGGIDMGMDGGIVVQEPLESGRRRIVIAEVAPTINVGRVAKGKTSKKRIPDMHRMARIMRVLVAAARKHETQLAFVLEKAQPMPLEGAVSSFAYGRGFGAWEALMAAFEIPYTVIASTAWQKVVLKDTEGTDTKARAVLVCQRRLPTLNLVLPRCRKPHTGLADSACMALFAEHWSW